MSKRPQIEVKGMYLYSPQSIPTVMCQLNIFRTDRTCRSMWPDASGQWQRSNWKPNTLSDWTRRRVRSGVTGRIRSRKTLSVLWPDARMSPIDDDQTRLVNKVPLWKWTGRTVDAFDRFPSHVRSRHLPSLTLVNMIYTSGPWEDRVQSIVLILLWLLVLTGRIRSRQRPRLVENKWLKGLQIATQLEPSFFQLNFGLHLSYLVLSLTSVHHT
jgi:hypothetical protein